jgi:inorganic pyrophosphatase
MLMDYWHDIGPGKNPPERLNIIIEIPQGSQNSTSWTRRTGYSNWTGCFSPPFITPEITG